MLIIYVVLKYYPKINLFIIIDFERRCIRATATVQAELGCPVSFHPGRNRRAPREIMRIYLEAGGNRQKVL